MEHQPVMSHQNKNYGTANPGYVPTAEGTPATFVPPAAAGDFPGYEGTVAGGGGGYVYPPMPAFPAPQPQLGPEQPHFTADSIPSITEAKAREAFALFASSKCCYSLAPVKDGVITRMDAFNTYRYRLETFTESRSTEWTHKPYNVGSGQPVDAFTQAPPGPWDVPAKTPSFFVNDKQVLKVPYTSSIKVCHECLGMGRNPCRACTGYGNKACGPCSGSGNNRVSSSGNNQCPHCRGRGRRPCSSCNGQGARECETCCGQRQLLVYIRLTVKWTNNRDTYVVEQSSGLRVDNLSKVSGTNIFRDSQYLVCPVKDFPDPAVVAVSQRLLNKHQGKHSSRSRILQQRQTIALIPVTKVTYAWKGNSHVYFVYGNEFKVNADDYPATCCCTVM